jgi:hypothetical protein
VNARKILELQRKAAALTAELAAWTRLASAGEKLQKHHSQIGRVAAQITGAIKALEEEIAHPAAGSSAEEIERRILDLHRVWNFFRSKLVLRSFDHFRGYLAIADELSYACYEPVIRAKGAAFREPPLVFFDEDSSPFAMPRNRSYAFALPSASLTNEEAAALLKALPVPVIGIPWFQQGHLPDLAIVAHEVGHHVEDDFGLAESLYRAVASAGVDPERRPAWLAWCGEVFADVYGTLAIGRAFPLALLEFLTSSDAAAMEAQVIAGPPWGDYPTAPLRIAVTRDVAKAAGTLDQELKDRTDSILNHAMQRFNADCETVVKAMLSVPVPNGQGTVSGLVTFDKPREANASGAANAALNEGRIQSRDVRELVAAAVLAWTRNPDRFNQRVGGTTPQDALTTQIRDSITEGTRGIPAIDKQTQTVAATSDTDAKAGRDLLSVFRHHI